MCGKLQFILYYTLRYLLLKYFKSKSCLSRKRLRLLQLLVKFWLAVSLLFNNSLYHYKIMIHGYKIVVTILHFCLCVLCVCLYMCTKSIVNSAPALMLWTFWNHAMDSAVKTTLLIYVGYDSHSFCGRWLTAAIRDGLQRRGTRW